MKKFKRHSFTLIELLAVIGIAALLIGIFTPAFSRMLVGSKVDQMASSFKTALEVAQAKSVSSRKYVAMILPNKYDEISDSRLKSYCGGGYRMAFVRKEGDSWVFNRWVPGSDWSNVADGAMLVAMTRDKDWLDDEKKFKPLPSTVSGTENEISGSGNLVEIIAKDSEDTDIKALGSADTDGKAPNWRGVIFTPYGGCVGSDVPLLFFFTEAEVSGSSYSYANKSDFIVLKLNPITGKVVYLPMEDGE